MLRLRLQTEGASSYRERMNEIIMVHSFWGGLNKRATRLFLTHLPFLCLAYCTTGFLRSLCVLYELLTLAALSLLLVIGFLAFRLGHSCPGFPREVALG